MANIEWCNGAPVATTVRLSKYGPQYVGRCSVCGRHDTVLTLDRTNTMPHIRYTYR